MWIWNTLSQASFRCNARLSQTKCVEFGENLQRNRVKKFCAKRNDDIFANGSRKQAGKIYNTRAKFISYSYGANEIRKAFYGPAKSTSQKSNDSDKHLRLSQQRDRGEQENESESFTHAIQCAHKEASPNCAIDGTKRAI